MDGTRLMARNGRSTRTVRIADKLKLSPGINDSTNLNNKENIYIYIDFIEKNIPSNNNETIKSIPGFS